MNDWKTVADDVTIEKTTKALNDNGIDVIVVKNAQEAKEKALSLIPLKSEVMTMTSETLRKLGVEAVLNESGDYDSIKTKLSKMDRKTQSNEMQKFGAAADYSIGSVHAVTEDGKVMIDESFVSRYAPWRAVFLVGTG